MCRSRAHVRSFEISEYAKLPATERNIPEGVISSNYAFFRTSTYGRNENFLDGQIEIVKLAQNRNTWGLSFTERNGIRNVHVVYVFYRMLLCLFLASSFTRFLDHTQRRTTVSRTPLDEWSARRSDLYLTTHTKLTTDIHAPGGIRTHNLNRRAAADLRLRPRGHWDRHRMLLVLLKVT